MIWNDIFKLNKSFIDKYLKEYKQNIFLFKDYFIHNNYSEISNLLENSLKIIDESDFKLTINDDYKKIMNC